MIRDLLLLLLAASLSAATCLSSDAAPTTAAPKYTPPPVVFRLDDLPFRTVDGRYWCPVPVTSLAWTECKP